MPTRDTTPLSPSLSPVASSGSFSPRSSSGHTKCETLAASSSLGVLLGQSFWRHSTEDATIAMPQICETQPSIIIVSKEFSSPCISLHQLSNDGRLSQSHIGFPAGFESFTLRDNGDRSDEGSEDSDEDYTKSRSDGSGSSTFREDQEVSKRELEDSEIDAGQPDTKGFVSFTLRRDPSMSTYRPEDTEEKRSDRLLDWFGSDSLPKDTAEHALGDVQPKDLSENFCSPVSLFTPTRDMRDVLDHNNVSYPDRQTLSFPLASDSQLHEGYSLESARNRKVRDKTLEMSRYNEDTKEVEEGTLPGLAVRNEITSDDDHDVRAQSAPQVFRVQRQLTLPALTILEYRFHCSYPRWRRWSRSKPCLYLAGSRSL